MSDLVERLRAMAGNEQSILYSQRETLNQAAAEIERLRGLINTPETDDFMMALPLEAAHQIERWGEAHDANKQPWDWYWALSHLASKAVHAAIVGDQKKLKHHIITSAALLLNWYRKVETDAALAAKVKEEVK